MYKRLLLFLGTCFLLHAPSSFCQTLTPAARAEIVQNISNLLIDNYVYLDTAQKMSLKIQSELKKGSYDRIENPVDFSDKLTNDLYTVYRDGHLQVQYFPPNTTTNTNAEPSPEARLQQVRNANFGFQKVEILDGNIGYIHLTRFWAGRENGGLETMKSALKFVQNTQALIIDVRNNGGGSQETATLLIGYFLEKPTLIETFYNRAEQTTTEYWTVVDSSLTSFVKMPLYILTSNKSFSCAEMLAYDLQALKRATIVGEVTGGGAHGTFGADASNGFVLQVPYWLGINPITHTNWEKVGVQPDIPISADKALETAELLIFEARLAQTKDSTDLFNLRWELDLRKAIHHPAAIDLATLKKYAGVYGERTFTLENGKLYYQRKGKPKFELEPMSNPQFMKGKGNNYFKIEFVADAKGKFNQVNAHYQDNRLETSYRNK